MSTQAPPILVRTDGKILDGRHRLRAAEMRGETEIEVCFEEKVTDRLHQLRPTAQHLDLVSASQIERQKEIDRVAHSVVKK
jgi:ParB-like chromosome segregation protein Spo0J